MDESSGRTTEGYFPDNGPDNGDQITLGAEWSMTGVWIRAGVRCEVCWAKTYADYDGEYRLTGVVDWMATIVEPRGWSYEFDRALRQGKWYCPTHVATSRGGPRC